MKTANRKIKQNKLTVLKQYKLITPAKCEGFFIGYIQKNEGFRSRFFLMFFVIKQSRQTQHPEE